MPATSSDFEWELEDINLKQKNPQRTFQAKQTKGHWTLSICDEHGQHLLHLKGVSFASVVEHSQVFMKGNMPKKALKKVAATKKTAKKSAKTIHSNAVDSVMKALSNP